MAQLIMDWINEEVCLSRRITSLEEDLKDGYLIGELLAFYNQQDDFDKFLSKGNPDAMINNFCLLEVSFKRLGITFNSKTAFDIMNGNSGVIRSLLYEIKTAVDVIVKTSQPIVVKTDGGEKGEKLVRVVPTTRPSYDKTMSQTFENCVRAGIANPSNVLIDKATSRFMDKERQFYQTIEKMERSSVDNYQEDFQRKKQMEKQRKRQEKEFMETWEKINVDQWKTNQLVARERKLLKQRVDDFANTKRQTSYHNMRVDARDQMVTGIDEFEEKLRNEIFPPDPDLQNTVGKAFKSFGGGDDTDIPPLTSMNKEFLDAGLEHSRKKLKEHHEELMHTQKIHNRRRLKFFSGSESSHMQFLRLKSESEIIEQLLKPSHSEVHADNARQEILLAVSMAKENADNRNLLVSELDEVAEERCGNIITEKASREFNWIVQPRTSAQIDLLEACKTAEASARSQETIDTAEDTLSKILDLTDFVCWTRDFTANFQGQTFGKEGAEIMLPENLWRDAVQLFTSNLPMPPPIPYTKVINETEELPFRLNYKPKFTDSKWLFKGTFTSNDILSFESTDKSASTMLATSDKDDFVSSLVQCVSEEAVEPGQGLESNPDDTSTSLPPDWVIASPPDYFLGEAIVAIRCAMDPILEDPEPPIVFPHDVLRLSICGQSETARKALSAQLKEDYGIEILIVENLVTEASKIGKDLSSDIEMSAYESLCQKAYKLVACGESISDQVYVDLIFAKLQELVDSEAFKGFVLEDFPRTRRQGQLLLLALSGIDYCKQKPHPTDRSSILAPPMPVSKPSYDVSKCGLDGVLGLESDLNRIITEKVSARKELKTGKIVYVDDSCSDVSTLAELYEPLNQPMTVGADLKMSDDLLCELKNFYCGLNLWNTFSAADFGEDQSLAVAVSKKVMTLYPDKLKNYPEPQVVEPEVPVADETTAEGTTPEADASAEDSPESQPEPEPAVEAAAESEGEVAEPALVKPPQRRLTVPLQLSMALDRIWNTAEESFVEGAVETFSCLRDVRYQMLQRYRATFNVVNSLIIRKDTKQALFEEFRDEKFNSIDRDLQQYDNIERDFRFDTDMMYEFYLRAIEFRCKIQNVTDVRQTEAKEKITEISKDGIILALVHRSRCEAAAMIQVELDRFNAACHIIFDTSKTLCKFNHEKKKGNVLEETLSADTDESEGADAGKGGKDKGKDKGKGKGDGPPVPYRPVLAPNILDTELMATVPTYQEPVEEDPKAKGKDKGKGEAEVPKDPFSSAEVKALEFLSEWDSPSFTVNRALYAFDDGTPVDPKAKGKGDSPVDPVVEAVCASVEKAVWCETNRCKRSIQYLKNVLSVHVAWLESTEASLTDHLTEVVEKQWGIETMANQRLIEMIIDKIDLCEQIRETWLISADSIAVLPSKLIIPDPPPPPVPVINEFYDYKLNDEQIEVLTAMIHEMKQGGYVLHEDLIQLSNIATNSSLKGCLKIKLAGKPAATCRTVRLPEKLAEITNPDDEYQCNEFLRRLIYRDQDFMDGYIGERYGQIHVDVLLDRLKNNTDTSKPSTKKVFNV